MTDGIPTEAARCHEQGREAGSNGDPVKALELFIRAHDLAPDWPAPPYDMAFTYLLADYLEEAEKWYAHVDELAPRGFFTCKRSLDTIRRELRGELPPGFSKAYAMTEWMPDDEKLATFRQITTEFPAFAPGWKDLAAALEDDTQKLAALDRGLACECDADTLGTLLLNKALVLGRRGQGAAGSALLTTHLRDPRCTTATEGMIKMTLPGLAHQQA